MVRFHDDFEPEFDALPIEVQDELLARAKILAQVDTLAGSKHTNMKEMRFNAANGAWRIAFASDPARSAVLLVAGDKNGVSQKRFYRSLIERADHRLDLHLAALRNKEK